MQANEYIRTNMEITIRPIQPPDNEALAHIIRLSIEALNLPTEGTAHSDPTTDNLFQHFQKANSFYWVAAAGDKVLGGCGIYPSNGLPDGCCELVRYFLAPEARGRGVGKTLLNKSVQTAKDLGYETMYLESFPDMKEAIRIYEQNGFEYLDKALGNTGHYACNVWMKMRL
jgi:putative acetyltransferase